MGWIFLGIAAVLYLVPCGVAISRGHRSQLAIGVLNIFLGWTVLGWIAALVWSCTANVDTQSNLRPQRACPFCAEPINAAAKRCKHCQADLTQQAKSCSCGRALSGTEKHCPRCGVKLD